jgi:hypothetical protein
MGGLRRGQRALRLARRTRGQPGRPPQERGGSGQAAARLRSPGRPLPTVFTRLVLGVIYLVLAVDILVADRRQLRSLAGALRED